MSEEPRQDTAGNSASPEPTEPKPRPVWLQALIGVAMAIVALGVLALLLNQLG